MQKRLVCPGLKSNPKITAVVYHTNDKHSAQQKGIISSFPLRLKRLLLDSSTPCGLRFLNASKNRIKLYL